jgi:uncharacterized protein (UPF0333 family)
MNNNGQNTIEYLLLVVAVVTVMLVFLAPHGKFQKGIENAMNKTTAEAITKADAEITF